MKVLAYTSPARGHLYPIVPIMYELAARGHHASVVALADELEPLAQLGIAGSAIDPVVERIQIEDWRERSLPSTTLRTPAPPIRTSLRSGKTPIRTSRS